MLLRHSKNFLHVATTRANSLGLTGQERLLAPLVVSSDDISCWSAVEKFVDPCWIQHAVDACYAMLDSNLHCMVAVEEELTAVLFHFYIIRAEDRSKPDSGSARTSWLVTYLNASACISQLCAIETEERTESTIGPFCLLIAQEGLFGEVCKSILRAIEVIQATAFLYWPVSGCGAHEALQL